MGFNISRDNRDNVFSPTRGTALSGSAEVAGGPFGGDKEFFRLIGTGVYDMPVFKVGKVKRGGLLSIRCWSSGCVLDC